MICLPIAVFITSSFLGWYSRFRYSGMNSSTVSKPCLARNSPIASSVNRELTSV